MAEDDDSTRPLRPIGPARQAPSDLPPPVRMVPEDSVRAPRLYGWNLAVTIICVSFAATLLMIVSLVIVFADRLPPTTP